MTEVSKLRQNVRDQLTHNVEGPICADCLERARSDYVRKLLERDRGELGELERQVFESIRDHDLMAAQPATDEPGTLTLGQRMADRVAAFGGSWTFIGLFGSVIVVWILSNAFILLNRGFDPYPFILLNLVLSCLAALQAPIIMMSQNRQSEIDRQRAMHDYKVNLKAELEVRLLHDKIDHLIAAQMHRLLEIQELQTDMLEDLIGAGSAAKGANPPS